jgi:hypothetical protein
MSRNRNLLAGAAILFILIQACNLLGAPAVVEDVSQDPVLEIQTKAVEAVMATDAALTEIAMMVESTLAAMTTDTPEFTPTSSLTPTPTFSPTPQVPMVSVSVQTNCRSGPGTAYDVLGIFNVGESGQVVGRSFYNDNWIVKLPSHPSITCWLWGQYATVTGDTSSLPIIAPPATPTPGADFTVSYSSFGVGPGYTCLKFMVFNTGPLTWSSYNFTVTDTNQGVSGASTDNNFVFYDPWCMASGVMAEIMPGIAGQVSAKLSLSSNPAGDHADTTLTLCTGDDLGGTCLTKSVGTVIGP